MIQCTIAKNENLLCYVRGKVGFSYQVCKAAGRIA